MWCQARRGWPGLPPSYCWAGVSPGHYPPSRWPVQSQEGVKVSPASACDGELSECWSQGKGLYIPSLPESIGKGQGQVLAKAKAVHA